MPSFRENVETVLAHYQQVSSEAVSEASDVRAINYERPKSKRDHGHVMLWHAPSTASTELEQIEQTMANLALLTRARNLERVMVTKYGAGTDTLRKARREMALEEVGRSPVEVALLYGYSNSHKVRELRVRHGRNAEDGAMMQKPLTSREVAA